MKPPFAKLNPLSLGFLILFLALFAGAASATTIPSGIQEFINFTVFNTNLTNSTGANFTQFIQLNASAYSQYLSTSLNNTEFFNDSGSVLPSWLEVGNSSFNNATWWVQIPYGITNNSNVTIYLGIANTTTNFFNSTGLTGEAPDLSLANGNGYYAQFDNGMQVFQSYFDGNTTNQSFSVSGTDIVRKTTATLNGQTINVLNFSAGSGDSGVAAILFNQSIANNPNYYVAESYLQYNNAGGFDMGFGLGSNNGGGTSANSIIVGSQFGNSYFDQAYVKVGTLNKGNNNQGSNTNLWRYSTLLDNSTTSFYAFNAPNLYTTVGGFSGTVAQNPIALNTSIFWLWSGLQTTQGNWVIYNWARVRLNPPGGVMPSVTNNGLTQVNGLTIYNPSTNTIYSLNKTQVNFSFSSAMFASMNASVYQNGTLINTSIVLNNTNASILSNALLVQSNNFTVTLFNGTTVLTGAVFPYVFQGVNITVSNAANGTILNGWNVTASNNTFTNWTNAQNSPYQWEWLTMPVNNTGLVWLNASKYNYAVGNFTEPVSNTSFLQLNLGIWPFEFFYVNSSQTGNLVSSYTLLFNNGTVNTSCITTNYVCNQSLQYLGLGNNTVTVIANGYITSTFYTQVNTTQVDNQTFLVASALLYLNAYDQQTFQALTFNVTISNSTNSTTYTNLVNGVSFNAGQIATGFLTITFVNASGGYLPASYFTVFNNNSAVNITAYLLQNSVGKQVGFNVVNPQHVALVGATVSASLFINNAWQPVGFQQTGSDGTASFFLNPTQTYMINATYQGQFANGSLIQPVNSLYTIVLGTLTAGNYTIFSNGTIFTLTPTGQIDGSGLTNTTIVFNVSSAITDPLNWFSLTLTWNGTTIFFANQSNSSTGGLIAVTINASQYVSIPNITATGQMSVQGFAVNSYSYIYYINTFGNPNGALSQLNNLTNQGLSPLTLAIFALIITILFAAWVTAGSSTLAGAVAALMSLGFFTAIGWISVVYFAIAFIIFLVLAGLAKGVIR